VELNKRIKAAIEARQPLYWQLDGNWLELRAVSYTWENGKERTKTVHIYYLKDQFAEVVETQRALGVNAPNNFVKELTPAFWNKTIDIHPQTIDFVPVRRS
jgi:hypothetical protein